MKKKLYMTICLFSMVTPASAQTAPAPRFGAELCILGSVDSHQYRRNRGRRRSGGEPGHLMHRIPYPLHWRTRSCRRDDIYRRGFSSGCRPQSSALVAYNRLVAEPCGTNPVGRL